MMIDRYLQFPLPQESSHILFSDRISLDSKNRFRIPTKIINALDVNSSALFDVLNFSDKEIPYIQYVLQKHRHNAQQTFLEDAKVTWCHDSYIIDWFAAREEYALRANTITLDTHQRLLVPGSLREQLWLQSAKEIHMIFSYPRIKVYSLDNYSRLLQSYADRKK